MLLKAASTILSILTHPLLMVIYLFLLYLQVNPYLFPYGNDREMDRLVMVILFTSVVIPLISMGLMLGVGFIETFDMKERTDRIGPLMITGIFYIWLYLNIRTHNAIPMSYSTFVLGTLFALAMAFFINNFSKISLHGVGLGGFLVGVLYLLLHHGGEYLSLSLMGSSYSVHYVLLLMILLLISGAALSSRLYLKAHTLQDVAGGFLVGVLGQGMAYSFF